MFFFKKPYTKYNFFSKKKIITIIYLFNFNILIFVNIFIYL